jgi:hypothetical protein
VSLDLRDEGGDNLVPRKDPFAMTSHFGVQLAQPARRSEYCAKAQNLAANWG